MRFKWAHGHSSDFTKPLFLSLHTNKVKFQDYFKCETCIILCIAYAHLIELISIEELSTSVPELFDLQQDSS